MLEAAFDQQSASSQILQVSQLGIGWHFNSPAQHCHITQLRIGNLASSATPADFDLNQDYRVVTTLSHYRALAAMNATNAKCDQQLGSLMDVLFSGRGTDASKSKSTEERGVFPLSGPLLSCPGTF